MTSASAVRTTCPYCGVGCGVLAKPQPDGSVKIEGDPDHPANFGKLCSKGLALGETLSLAQRQLHPIVDGLETGWDHAITTVADRFKQTIADHGPESVAFYVSGQLLTEDYYVANKLMKGFIGTANIDTNSRLCMASAVAGHKRAFGADIVPCSYSDLEAADLIILVGSNLAWCHPVLFQRIMAERKKRDLKLVVIDPRRTPTAEAADLHLQISPDTDVALFNGLLANLYRRGEVDSRFVFARTSGLAETLVAANEWTLEKTAAATDVSTTHLYEFFDLFANHAKTVTMFSMGVNQSASGTDKVNAIINCHLLTGRIGKKGMGPFSITGQPNAMGGREVGGLANMLAAHMDFDNAKHSKAVQDHWQSPTIAAKPGLKAVDMFDAVADGRIKALWIISTNPVVSMPNATAIAEALEICPFVVVSDVTNKTDTAKFAGVFLPAAGWGEKSGTVTNSERLISRQRAFLPKPGAVLPDWKIISDVATAMGFEGFAYTSPAEIFAEHVTLTQKLNNGSRKLDLAAWQDQNYDTLQPQQWGGENPFKDLRFQTPDGKARFVATTFRTPNKRAYTLNTGRIRDQWHTMTRTGLSPRLFNHRAEPYVEIHPADASGIGIAPATLVEISANGSRSIARALVTDAVKPGDIFQPMHWNRSFAKDSLANACTGSKVDPISGQPALKTAGVNVAPYAVAWYGFGITQKEIYLPADYFAVRPIVGGMAFECAGKSAPNDWGLLLYEALANGGKVSSLQSHDAASFRCVVMRGGKLTFAFFASQKPVEVSRSWIEGQLGADANPLEIIAGRPHAGREDHGPILCACMNVGRNRISHFIRENTAASLQTVCDATTAGTGCGSCRIEVQRIMSETQKSISSTGKTHSL
jgi:assimilatory nitrate reductase catalytic subunit